MSRITAANMATDIWLGYIYICICVCIYIYIVIAHELYMCMYVYIYIYGCCDCFGNFWLVNNTGL